MAVRVVEEEEEEGGSRGAGRERTLQSRSGRYTEVVAQAGGRLATGAASLSCSSILTDIFRFFLARSELISPPMTLQEGAPGPRSGAAHVPDPATGQHGRRSP